LASIAFIYVRGWLRLRSPSFEVIDSFRGGGFLLGVGLIWIAVASPLASGDAHLLTVHMVQHLFLASVAPPLIWLGEPVQVLLWGLPQRATQTLRLALRQHRAIRRLGTIFGYPAVCWLAATAALVG